jgi:Subunit 21 of Mediator complex
VSKKYIAGCDSYLLKNPPSKRGVSECVMEQGSAVDAPAGYLPPAPQEADAVSLLQDHVDLLALAMFDAIRLLPQAEAEPAPLPMFAGLPIATCAVQPWDSKVKALADKVVFEALTLDSMIDQLPGADKSELQQLDELRELAATSAKLQVELTERAAEARALMTKANTKLDELADAVFAPAK